MSHPKAVRAAIERHRAGLDNNPSAYQHKGALKQIVVGASKAGKPVAMCGDMAGDPMLAWVLVGLGLRNLSMAPRQIPLVKSIIRSTNFGDAERLLAQAMTMSTEVEIEEMVYGAMTERFPLELNDGEDDRAPG